MSHVTLTPPTTTPTLDEHGHVQLKNPIRRFSLSGESMTSFDHRLPADGQAQSEDGGCEGEDQLAQRQISIESPSVEQREGGEGKQTQWAELRQAQEVS